MLEGQQVMVRCPDRASQGDLIQIEFQVVINTKAAGGTDDDDDDNTRHVGEGFLCLTLPCVGLSIILLAVQASTFIVTVPDGVREGQVFEVMVRGQRQRVTCPQGVRPGMQIRFSLPPTVPGGAPPPVPEPTPFEKLYEVVVPQVS